MTNTDSTIKLALKLRTLIQSTHGKPMKKEELEKIADEILFWQASFIKHLIESEQVFRERIRALQAEDMSFAAAENQAKTEECYTIFKKCQHIYALGEEKIRLLKLMISNNY